MTRRRVLLFGLVATLAGAAVAAWILWPRTSITQENIAKITQGMTLAEVESILGGPARDETDGIALIRWMPDKLRTNVEQRAWVGPRHDVVIRFIDDRVAGIRRNETFWLPESTSKKLRRWLRL